MGLYFVSYKKRGGKRRVRKWFISPYEAMAVERQLRRDGVVDVKLGKA